MACPVGGDLPRLLNVTNAVHIGSQAAFRIAQIGVTPNQDADQQEWKTKTQGVIKCLLRESFYAAHASTI